MLQCTPTSVLSDTKRKSPFAKIPACHVWFSELHWRCSLLQMWAFVSDGDSLMGPYSPTQRRFRISGGLGGWGTCYSFGGLGAWVPPSAHGEALISQYITPKGGSAGRYDVWLLPMRKPVAAQQADGTPFLRLGYWSGNDVLRGASVQPTQRSTYSV